MTETFRLATRGSALALRQAASVKEALETRKREVELVEVQTKGDEITDDLIHRLGKTGAFVRALDERVLDGDVDAAIHSMKDMPTEMPSELVVAGVPERAAAGDVLVTPNGTDLDDLPEGAVVGTGSLRRGAELLARRPDLNITPLRGNVDTRVEKLLAPGLQQEHDARTEAEKTDDGGYSESVETWFSGLHEIERRALERDVETEFDAIVLAESGLQRAGILPNVEYQRLPTKEFVPAPGQGAIAVTTRDGELAETVKRAVDFPRSRVETTVERTVLRELNGGCIAPIGVHAVMQGPYVHTSVRVLSRDGTEEVSVTRDLTIERHHKAAKKLGADLREQGAAELIEEARRSIE
ncbi:hydroxymethylbilane synthase [Natronomonas sp. EA1]|uniref:hydroxymethylbilane synthase n=1 Tax=Natronomonas sp. EA1 TaxID=3421655 RepID=UPI003EB9DBBC